MKKRQLPKMRFIFTLLIIVLILLVWLACMFCVTAVRAEREAYEYLDENRYRASTIADRNFEYWLEREDLTENYVYSKFLEAVSNTGVHSKGTPVINGHSGFFELDDKDHTYAANAIFDGEGKLLLSSFEDFFYFEYLTEKQWNHNEERSGIYTRAVFDRSLLSEEAAEFLKQSHLDRAMRFTGRFDGADFIASKIEYIDPDEFNDALWSRGSGHYTISGIIQTYDLQWYTLYDNPAVATENDITIYSDWFEKCYPEISPEFEYNGEKYENLNVLVEEIGPELSNGIQNFCRYDGLNLILISADYCETINGETTFNRYYYGDAVQWEEGTEHSMNFYLVSAVLCSPWKTAMQELIPVYLWTLGISLILTLIAISIVNRHYIEPVQRISAALNGTLPSLADENYKLREIRELYTGYSKAVETIHYRKNEIRRLNTALDFAKTAEENRRQMTSNIAHELKTPLAIIHSYSEGLKEQIAEEKRDKYLDVILSETERMDAMVLEMLDLSRLEAGKVKLSNDVFSLKNLTDSIFEKLRIAMDAKDIEFSLNCEDDSQITADESRIAQVIENFATNAVKYTPNGGYIKVNISKRRDKTTFTVENQCTPLSEEALRKVWDTFYRTDESRSSIGTGLGLAIAKNIIELHSGKCFVRNTETGVEFSFVI